MTTKPFILIKITVLGFWSVEWEGRVGEKLSTHEGTFYTFLFNNIVFNNIVFFNVQVKNVFSSMFSENNDYQNLIDFSKVNRSKSVI